MDLLNSLDQWNKNKLKSKVIYGMLFNNEVKKEICSLMIQKNSLAYIFLFEDITNNPDNTLLYKLVRNAINNFDDLEYYKFLKQILSKNSLISYLENTDLFEFENEFSVKYFDNENFKQTMFGSFWAKSSNNFNYLNELFQISLENDNWKIMLKWFWKLIKDKYEQTYLVNFDNCIDYTLIDISSIILNNFITRYNHFHFNKLSENAYERINEILLTTNYTFDIIDDFNSKFDSLFLTCILLLNIVFVPLKNNYTNILSQINLIENQLLNISLDFTMLYETTKLNLINKCKEEIKINSEIISNISNNLKSNGFLNNSLKFSEFISKILIKKIDNEEELYPYLTEILSDIVNFNITYNLNTKIYDFIWDDLINLSLKILKNPELTNNNPHVRFSFIDIILSGTLKSFNFKDNKYLFISDKKRNNFKLLSENEFFKKNMINTLLNVYIDIDKLGDDLDITLKPKAKFDIINILINLINGYTSYKYFFKNINFDTNLLIIKVINIIVNDISNNLDDIFFMTKSVYNIHFDGKSGILGYLDSISNLMKFILNSFNFLLTLQNISLETFESDIIFQKLIETFNYYLYWSNGLDPDKKDSKNLSKIFYIPESLSSFNINVFISCIIHFYVNISNIDKFYKVMIEDKRSFRLDFIKKGITIYTNTFINCNKKKLLEFHEPYSLSLCENMLTKLEEKPIEIIEKEPPDNFIDPITFTLINDPVILPSSKMIVDRTVIVKHLINCNNDPFTRDNLTIEKLNEFNLQNDINEKTEKLKREIINWKK